MFLRCHNNTIIFADKKLINHEKRYKTYYSSVKMRFLRKSK